MFLFLLSPELKDVPISKRRIENFGEEEQYYIKDHHEAIVSPEIWDMAQEIRTKRSHNHPKQYGDKREKYTRKYALSSMCECGFCGTKLTRRMLHSSSKYATPSWYCRTAANKGKLESGKENEDLCSFYEDEFTELYSSCGSDTCGVRNKAPKERYVKLLDFRHFERHMMFSRSDKKEKKKAISDGVNVSVVMEL